MILILPSLPSASFMPANSGLTLVTSNSCPMPFR
ncbi:unnamed protein product [Staurois parvus]|uniref:Uncharacterized protein n=1 Tax=Staurois parvus TaxID=386267 RepID=A0ABN9FTZ6_9NEOB|nr:unnamed protein product [Staurois parvus]